VTVLDGDPPFRILPRLIDQNREFWTGGAAGELRFWRCQDDQTWIHPWQPLCPTCRGKNLAVEPMSGKATLGTYTINHQPWMPGPELPFVVAIVEMEDDPSVRLMTNLVNCPHDQIRSGMPVRVVFEMHPDPDGDIYIPLFEPDGDR
jgi:uncharacterized OB-fold protein